MPEEYYFEYFELCFSHPDKCHPKRGAPSKGLHLYVSSILKSNSKLAIRCAYTPVNELGLWHAMHPTLIVASLRKCSQFVLLSIVVMVIFLNH